MQSSALLELARALSTAATSTDVARRLSDSVPVVVDCDRVGVYLWDAARGELVREAITQVSGDGPAKLAGVSSWTPAAGGIVEKLLLDPRPDPIFVDRESGDPVLSAAFSALGFAATIVVPLVAPGRFLGFLSVSVNDAPGRLRPSADLLDRLSGVAAQATTALQNGQLVDQITYQALHDQLTGLANRVQFSTELRAAIHWARGRAQLVTLFYLDLDRFKPVNDDLGHDAGDELLVAVAERIATALSEPFEVGGGEVTIGASVGRAVYPLTPPRRRPGASRRRGVCGQARAAGGARPKAPTRGRLGPQSGPLVRWRSGGSRGPGMATSR